MSNAAEQPGTTQAGGATVTAPADAFAFGRNWQRYVATHLTPEREWIAAESLRDLVGDMRGKTMLDIGCGSGLFSLCAHRAGAAHIVSLDVDPDAVHSTRGLRARIGAPANWEVHEGSILDSVVAVELEPADVVYSWGVLHHTGDMHRAIANASALVKPGGTLAIAIYNRVTNRWLSSERWLAIKRAYNRAPRTGQRAMEATFGAYWMQRALRSGQNPLRAAGDYKGSRGMALATDARDWLGGYPYEFATAEEIIGFCADTLGLDLQHLIAVSERDPGNNQFVFTRPVS